MINETKEYQQTIGRLMENLQDSYVNELGKFNNKVNTYGYSDAFAWNHESVLKAHTKLKIFTELVKNNKEHATTIDELINCFIDVLKEVLLSPYDRMNLFDEYKSSVKAREAVAELLHEVNLLVDRLETLRLKERINAIKETEKYIEGVEKYTKADIKKTFKLRKEPVIDSYLSQYQNLLAHTLLEDYENTNCDTVWLEFYDKKTV